MQIKLKVTQEDINRGTKGSAKSCPVALALTREGYTNVSVAGDVLMRVNDETWYLPFQKDVSNFVQAFDRGDKVEPTEFAMTFQPSSLSTA